MIRDVAFVVAAVALFNVARSADAHFPWLAIDKEGHAVYFFGENPADRTYHLPESIGKAKVQAVTAKRKTKQVKLKPVESDDFVGLVSMQPVAKDAKLTSQVTYGVFRGSRLDYYTVHQPGKLPTSREAYQGSESPDLSAQLVDTDSGVDVYVLWKGKPLNGVKVQLFCEEGHEEGAAETDEAGKVSFNDKQVEDGLNGIMVGHTVADEAGKIDDKPYQASMHYLTVTFHDPQDFEKSKAE